MSIDTRRPLPPLTVKLPNQVASSTIRTQPLGHNVILVSSINGALSQLNALAQQYKAKAIIHTGNFGFYDASSIERIPQDVLLARLEGKMEANTLDNAAVALARLREQPTIHSELPDFISGKKRFDIPIYTIWGEEEDLTVIDSIKKGIHNIPNLYILDHRDSYAISTDDHTLRLFGLGGAFTLAELFNVGEGNDLVAGEGGFLWATMLQLGELLELGDKYSGPDHEGETRLFISNAPACTEPLALMMAASLKADVSLCTSPNGQALSFTDDAIFTETSLSRFIEETRQDLRSYWEQIYFIYNESFTDAYRGLCQKVLTSVAGVSITPSSRLNVCLARGGQPGHISMESSHLTLSLTSRLQYKNAPKKQSLEVPSMTPSSSSVPAVAPTTSKNAPIMDVRLDPDYATTRQSTTAAQSTSYPSHHHVQENGDGRFAALMGSIGRQAEVPEKLVFINIGHGISIEQMENVCKRTADTFAVLVKDEADAEPMVAQLEGFRLSNGNYIRARRDFRLRAQPQSQQPSSNGGFELAGRRETSRQPTYQFGTYQSNPQETSAPSTPRMSRDPAIDRTAFLGRIPAGVPVPDLFEMLGYDFNLIDSFNYVNTDRSMMAIRFKDPADVSSFIDRFRSYTLPSGARVYAEYPRQSSRHASSSASRTPRQDSHPSTSTMPTPTPAAPISTNTSTISHQSSQPSLLAGDTYISQSKENDASLTWPME